MKIEDIIQFLHLLRVGGVEVNSDHTWIKSSCFAPSTPVLSSLGVVSIEDVVVGDCVLTYTDGFHRVIATHKHSPLVDVLRVSVRGLNYSFDLTCNHTVWAVKKSDYVREVSRIRSAKRRKGQSTSLDLSVEDVFVDIQELSIGSLEDGDYLIVPSLQVKVKSIESPLPVCTAYTQTNQYGVNVPCSRFPQIIPSEYPLDFDLGCFMGAYLAEGNVGFRELASGDKIPSYIAFSFKKGEKLSSKIQNLGRKLFCLEPCLKKNKTADSEQAVFSNGTLSLWFLTLFGRGAANKVIPEFVFSSPIEFIRGFLQGYWEGDGNYVLLEDGTEYKEYSTTSRNISFQLPVLLAYLGLSCRISKRKARIDKNGVKHKKSYSICVSTKQSRALGRRLSGHLMYPIKIEKLLKRPRYVHNLTVEGQQAYVVGSLSVHNCPLAPMSHAGGTDSTPSFGINVNSEGMSGWHCFEGNTGVLTQFGVSPIRLLVDQHVMLLTEGGQWVKSFVRAFGKQPLMEVTLQRNHQTKKIFCTPEHRWFTRLGSGRVIEKTTKELRPKHRLVSSIQSKPKLSKYKSDWWVCRGFVFGDGSRQKNHSRATFYGEKDRPMIPFFKRCWGKEPAGKDPKVQNIFGMPYEYKDLPGIRTDRSYLYDWLRGYVAADGCVDKKGTVILSSGTKEHLKFVRNMCSLLGIGTYGITTQERLGYGTELSELHHVRFDATTLTPDFFLLPKHRNRFSEKGQSRFRWSVVSVEETDRIEMVYCAEVPGTHSFTIEDNILTGNCFTCGSGSLAAFIHRLTWTVGATPSVHAFFLEREILSSLERKDGSDLSYPDAYSDILPCVDEAPGVPVPDEILNEYPPLMIVESYEATRVRQWFTDRDIPLDLVYEYDIRLNEDYRSFLFPITDFDENGVEKIYHLHNRSRVDKAFWYLTGKSIGRPDLVWGNKNYWFGITKVDLTQPIYLVESETDLLMLRKFGVNNVVAACGGLGADKLMRVAGAPVIYLGYDSDKAGLKYVKKSIEVLHSSALLIRLSWRTVGLKDAGDLRNQSQWDSIFAERMLVQYQGNRIYAQSVSAMAYRDRYANSL